MLVAINRLSGGLCQVLDRNRETKALGTAYLTIGDNSHIRRRANGRRGPFKLVRCGAAG